MKNYVIPIFIPELACPNQCVYCNQRAISGQLQMPTREEIIKTIETYLPSFKSESVIQLGFFGGNFTGIDLSMQKDLLSLIQPYIKEGKIDSIKLSTRPDYINYEVLDLLRDMRVKTIELGVQSFDDEVLHAVKRGYDKNVVENAALMIKEYGFELGMQMMIGLPFDTKEKSIQTAQKIIKLGADCTRIYPTLVIQNTELEKMYRNGLYKPLSIMEAIEWTKPLLMMFDKAGVVVLRVGLHPTKDFINKTSYIEGPFHVSFKELVLSEIWSDILSKNMPASQQIKVVVPECQINYVIGYGAKNKKRLNQVYEKVDFVTSSQLKNFEFRIEEM